MSKHDPSRGGSPAQNGTGRARRARIRVVQPTRSTINQEALANPDPAPERAAPPTVNGSRVNARATLDVASAPESSRCWTAGRGRDPPQCRAGRGHSGSARRQGAGAAAFVSPHRGRRARRAALAAATGACRRCRRCADERQRTDRVVHDHACAHGSRRRIPGRRGPTRRLTTGGRSLAVLPRPDRVPGALVVPTTEPRSTARRARHAGQATRGVGLEGDGNAGPLA